MHCIFHVHSNMTCVELHIHVPHAKVLNSTNRKTDRTHNVLSKVYQIYEIMIVNMAIKVKLLVYSLEYEASSLYSNIAVFFFFLFFIN